ncbi:MAG: serine/threonine protein kinase, partial [Gemmatimonadota bacterium]|nr:serine/threonine protein kinase [Gemmatimonadota bacterium]
MTPERWQQVKQVMALALRVSPSERARVVSENCQNDGELQTDVMSLLAASREDDSRDDDSTSAPDGLRAAIVAEAQALTKTHNKTDVETLRKTLQANLGLTYDILSTLGVGGMGAVFLARERALDRYVAIKVLRAEQAVTTSSQERFRREARIAAQLSHPGILPLHAFGEVAGMWYLVMGYVRGQSLAQRMHTQGRLPSDEVWRTMRAVAEALEHAHQRQVIHRDIKPANILIDGESSRPMLADFGISKVLGEVDVITQTGDLLGTPHFMSPEQLANAA